MKLIYNVDDKPKFSQLIILAIQQLLAIMAATLVVPVIVSNDIAGNDMSPAAALFGAGVGTLIYVLCTRRKSPVFLGSSFAFLASMSAAFTGAVSMSLGFAGLIIGAAFAGLVYVVIALVVKFAGVKWIDKLMPPVVIGPTVTIIGLSLAGNAVGDIMKGNVINPEIAEKIAYVVNCALCGGEIKGSCPSCSAQLALPVICLLCGLVTLFTVMACSTYGKKTLKLIPFIIGILAGYAVAGVLTLIGNVAGIDAIKVLDITPFQELVKDGVTLKTFLTVPQFTFLEAYKGIGDINSTYIAQIAVAYIPVAFVVFAEHIADHKNISSIIEKDLLKEPGLHRTLLGDGIGSIFGAFFGGCPNTTYGESVACVAITRNASVATIITAAIGAIIISFVAPFVAFVNSIPSCVMGGVCIALYGFIAVSGLKMFKNLDLEDNKNLFVVSVILIAGIGGLSLKFGAVKLTSIACALILGVLANLFLSLKKSK